MTENSGIINSNSFQAVNFSAGTGSLFSVSTSSDTTSKNQNNQYLATPKPEQIRLWRQRELNRMFHGQKKELVPRNQVLIESKGEPNTGLVLPSRPITNTHQDWFAIIIFLSLMLFASVRHGFGNYLSALFQSIFNYSTASRMFRERNISLYQGEIRLEIFSYLVFGLLIYQAASQYNLNLPFEGFIRYILSFAVVVVFFTGKKIFYQATGFLFENMNETAEFLYNYSNYIRVAGIVVLPFIASIAWAPVYSADPVFLTGLIIVTILYVFLLWRGLKIFLKKQFSIFYLFLYLCTLEILPLALVIKLIAG